jgi:hypothetical protein
LRPTVTGFEQDEWFFVIDQQVGDQVGRSCISSFEDGADGIV